MTYWLAWEEPLRDSVANRWKADIKDAALRALVTAGFREIAAVIRSTARTVFRCRQRLFLGAVSGTSFLSVETSVTLNLRH
jgi:hypothetical protein